MSLKKTKPFVISSEAKNSAGFRVRTAGIDTSGYANNPVMLYDHDPKQILGNGEDVHVDGVKLMFTPAFDTSDPAAEKVYNKVQNGTIRMASAGLIPLKWGKDDEGEIWLEESKLRECTITLFGANPEALAVQLYDEHDNLIKLNEEYVMAQIPNQNQDKNMKTINLEASKALPLVKLADGATPEEFVSAVQQLVTLSETQAQQIVTLSAEKVEANKLKLKAEEDLKTLKAEQAKSKLVELVDKAVVDGKITADQKVDFLGDETKEIIGLSYEQAKNILDKLAPQPSIKSLNLKAGKVGEVPEDLAKMSWDELDAAERTVELMELDYGMFNEKFKARFKRDYKPE